MIIINKYILDFDKTYEEFLFHIKADRTLSVEIIKAIDFKKGTFFTILEGEAFADDLYRFGGSLPISFSTEEEESEFFQWEPGDFIQEFLQKDPSNVGIMNPYNPEDARFHEPGVDVAFFNKEVHYLVYPDTPLRSLSKAVDYAGFNVWYLLVVLTSGLKLPNKNKLEEKDFDTVCKNTQYIMTTTYDGEGYLFWERNK